MAINTHEYFDHYKRSTLTFFICALVISAAIAGALIIALWQAPDIEPLAALAYTLLTLVAANIICGLAIFAVASKPLQIISQAIAHVSDDPVVTPPPAVDAPKYQRSGLKKLVQTVYGLAAAQTGTTQTPPAAQPAQLLAELTNDLPCGVIAYDKTGNITYANRLAPVTDQPDGGKASTLLFGPKENLETWVAAADANKVRDTHTWQRIADKLPGEAGRRIFDIAAYYQKDNPAGIAVILVAFDRSNIYNSDEDDMDFIALAAHELRGPITVIRGYLDVIKSDLGSAFSQDQQELFDRLQVSSERLAGYVTNILNVSRYDRHQFGIHLHQEDLSQIIKELLPDLTLRAHTQHRTLTFNIPENLPPIAADRSSLGEVVTNLVDNAIKYSHENGEVTVTATPKEGDMVEVTVQDKGIGIPASVVGGLFNKFYRSHRSRQSVGGTGLGLYICKAIVEAHGGSIWVSSHEGQGSTFGFTVPVYSAAVAARLQTGDNQSKDIVQRPEGWIKNHAMYRR